MSFNLNHLHINNIWRTMLITVVGQMILAACSSTPSTDADRISDLDHAQSLIESADFAEAQKLCDRVRETQVKNHDRNAAILGRLSILYMKLADNTERDENVGYAYQCFLEAFSTDSIGAQEYYNNLSIDDMPQGVLLAGIVHSAIDLPGIMTHDEEFDSTATCPHCDTAPAKCPSKH